MSEEENPLEHGGHAGLSLVGPFILAALIGNGIILAAIAVIWLIMR